MLFSRSITQDIVQSLFQGKIIIIYGPRQVGKTTFLKTLLQTHGDDAHYINCDLIENREGLSTQSADALKRFVGTAQLLLIDEAQRVPNIGINLKILHDTYPTIQIIVTGSSSFDLANTINEPLTGRTRTFTMFPLSLHEYCRET
jgi:uncharacterized protein